MDYNAALADIDQKISRLLEQKATLEENRELDGIAEEEIAELESIDAMIQKLESLRKSYIELMIIPSPKKEGIMKRHENEAEDSQKKRMRVNQRGKQKNTSTASNIQNPVLPQRISAVFCPSSEVLLHQIFPKVLPAALRSGETAHGGLSQKYEISNMLEFRQWNGFLNAASRFSASLPRINFSPPVVLNIPGTCNNERAVESYLEYVTFLSAASYWNQLYGLPRFDNVKKGKFERVAGRSAIGDPDFIWTLDDCPGAKAVIEIKTPWVLPSLDNASSRLATECAARFEDDTLARSNLLTAVQQSFIYMTLNNLRYGALTTFDETIFLRKVERDSQDGERSVIEFSPAIKCDVSDPLGIVAAWLFFINTVESDPRWMYASPVGSQAVSKDLLVPQQFVGDGTRYDPRDLQKCINFKSIIGRGHAGAVVVGSYGDEDDVVFKTIDLKTHPHGREQFDQEVQVYRDLEELQGSVIPKFYAYGNYYGLLQIMVLEHVGRPITEQEYLDRKDDIDNAIKMINNMGYKHNDLFPRNIMINDETGGIRIIDFGLSVKVVGPIRENVSFGN